MLEENSQRGVKLAYTIVERDKDGRKFWVRVGAAFVDRDGSFGAVGLRHPRLLLEVRRHAVEQQLAVAALVAFEDVGSQRVAAAVPHADGEVDADLQRRHELPVSRFGFSCAIGSCSDLPSPAILVEIRGN